MFYSSGKTMRLYILSILCVAEITGQSVDQTILDGIFGTEDNPKLDPDINLKPSDTDTTCKTDDGRNGVCVNYYQCKSDTRTVIVDGETLLDTRIGACARYYEVCCVLPEVNKRAPKPTPPPAVIPIVKQACGYSNPGALEGYDVRIDEKGNKTKQMIADYAEYPWMVAVLEKTEGTTGWSQKHYLGGGALIHQSVVITSAHKVYGKEASELKIRAGEWDTQIDSETYPYQERDVAKITIHEHFDRTSILNSVALLYLKSPIDLTNAPHIGIACLGRQLPQPGTRCWSMGWGKTDFKSEDKYVVILKKVELPLVSRSRCQNALRGTRLGSYFQLHSSLTCAGGEGPDTCGGDGGSPLVCRIGKAEDQRYAVNGLVAYGIGCGNPNVPGVYVNLPQIYDWVGLQMSIQGYGTDSFGFQ